MGFIKHGDGRILDEDEVRQAKRASAEPEWDEKDEAALAEEAADDKEPSE